MTDREQFEQHFKLTIRQQKRFMQGDYRDELTQARWEGWQAREQLAAPVGGNQAMTSTPKGEDVSLLRRLLDDQQIVDTLARHGIGWLGFSDDQSVTAYPLDGEDAPVYIAAVRELLGQPAQGERKPDDAARYKVVLKKEYADYQQKAQALELTILPFDIYVRQYNGIIDAEIRFLA